VRIAIVTRSAQYETDVVTPPSLTMFGGADAIADVATTVTMTLTADQRHYRYKVLETVIPLRNAMWNSP
jgi:type IV pilus assembly protein PilW